MSILTQSLLEHAPLTKIIAPL